MHFLSTIFSWPNGIVVGNLLASVLWVPVGAAGTYLIERHHHKKLHAKLDAIHDHLGIGHAPGD